MAKSRTYQEVLPYLHFEDGAYIYKDGRVCCGLRVVPYEYERFTAREIEELNLRVNRVFNDLPDYANLQMLRRLTKTNRTWWCRGRAYLIRRLRSWRGGGVCGRGCGFS